MYQYGVLGRGAGADWVFFSAAGRQGFINFLTAMNSLGSRGWEAVAAGDLGGSASPEILLKLTGGGRASLVDRGAAKAMADRDAPFPAPAKGKDGPFPKSRKPRRAPAR
jgi:hypothetical protein